MYFTCAAAVQILRGLPKLCAADYGIVDQQQFLAGDQFVDRDQFHLGDQISSALMSRHKGPGPCGRIFNKRSRIGDL